VHGVFPGYLLYEQFDGKQQGKYHIDGQFGAIRLWKTALEANKPLISDSNRNYTREMRAKKKANPTRP
jgi:hypothetical protein